MAVTSEHIRLVLKQVVARDGFVETAKQYGLHVNALNGLLRGKGEIDPTAARRLGFERRVLYVPLQEDAETGDGGDIP